MSATLATGGDCHIGMLHVASSYMLADPQDPHVELVESMVRGMLHVLEVAHVMGRAACGGDLFHIGHGWPLVSDPGRTSPSTRPARNGTHCPRCWQTRQDGGSQRSMTSAPHGHLLAYFPHILIGREQVDHFDATFRLSTRLSMAASEMLVEPTGKASLQWSTSREMTRQSSLVKGSTVTNTRPSFNAGSLLRVTGVVRVLSAGNPRSHAWRCRRRHCECVLRLNDKRHKNQSSGEAYTLVTTWRRRPRLRTPRSEPSTP